ncbi:CPBP family intramembrane glutamic endopeptidase [Thermococcus gammatolerans]|uniref:Zinc-dependant protease, putative n=1 Tax=Thermococcus gammatolerans (strain DSM 15229 / JCM 11827 / EJ3) TaxID=593117 RepID=C5A2M4_THEGJ|nr:CPBP family intramembrane glutamic endopeptidase [Thermococcus gammatolerans]ACS32526.1 Zinc-dependant protease, putative [Thermococcus gammatolerans EJ3]
MIEFAVALTLWLLILSASGTVATLVAGRWAKKAGFAMQLTMFFLSLAVIELMGGPQRFGLVPDFRYVPQAVVLGFGASLIINLLEGNPSVPMEEFMPEGVERLVLLLILAPLGEEVFTRGLIEGYILGYGHFWSAILFSALLFALPHWMAYEGSKKRKIVAVGGAFVLGSLAGYLFALGGIIPAIVLHSSANLAGLIVLRFKEKNGN